MTQPKNRPLADPRIPPSVSRTSSLMTASGAIAVSGRGFVNLQPQLFNCGCSGDRSGVQRFKIFGRMRCSNLEDVNHIQTTSAQVVARKHACSCVFHSNKNRLMTVRDVSTTSELCMPGVLCGECFWPAWQEPRT